MTKTVWVFIAILTSFGEASTENQSLLSKIERLEAENAQLKTENARLMQLEAENVWLKAEITRLQRRETVDKDALSEIQTAQSSRNEQMCPRHPTLRFEDYIEESARGDHCQNRCDLDLDLINKSCRVTRQLLSDSRKRLKMVQDHPHPKWEISMFGSKYAQLELGTVECPCALTNGTLLSEREASQHILSQVAILNVGTQARYLAQSWHRSSPTGERILLSSNVLIAYAVGAMVRCWVQQCRLKQQRTTDELLGLLELEDSNELTASWNAC